jgi:molybdopterin synthase catalytic subunit
MAVELRSGPFDPYAELTRYQREVLGHAGRYGATACFVGTMRDINNDRAVTAMMLEHYPGMTDKHLQEICAEAMKRWDILDALIVHRVGAVRPNDPIVLTAAWSAHRAPAFEACRFMIEDLKRRAPFWKKEQHAEGSAWVTHNTPAAN